MGNNYSKFYQQPKNTENSVNNGTVEENKMEEVFEEVINDIVEDADVLTNDEVEQLSEEDIIDVEVTEQGSMVTGIVTNCTRLNVRKEADKEAEIVCVINKGVNVAVNLDESTEDFYKVCTPAGTGDLFGVEGYCMKQFIEIK